MHGITNTKQDLANLFIVNVVKNLRPCTNGNYVVLHGFYSVSTPEHLVLFGEHVVPDQNSGQIVHVVVFCFIVCFKMIYVCTFGVLSSKIFIVTSKFLC